MDGSREGTWEGVDDTMWARLAVGGNSSYSVYATEPVCFYYLHIQAEIDTDKQKKPQRELFAPGLIRPFDKDLRGG